MKFKFVSALTFLSTFSSLIASVALGASDFQTEVTNLETKLGAKIGFYAEASDTTRILSSREDERFLMCSTFKAVLCAHVLSRVDQKLESLDRVIKYKANDLIQHSPETGKKAHNFKMSVRDLCKATVELSDNAAANLLLEASGGPTALTHFLRTLGDQVTRLDRKEPELNNWSGDNFFDTTAPKAMVETLRKIFLQGTLTETSRDLLKNWMLASETGARRLSAGLPKNWQVADKTGTGPNGATNDIGLIYRPNGKAPIVFAAYISDSKAKLADREAALAHIASLVAKEMP